MNQQLSTIPQQELVTQAVAKLRQYFMEHKLSEKEADVPWQVDKTFNDVIKGYMLDYGMQWESQMAVIWGLHIRSFLRKNGFGENYLQIGNLNDYWMSFLKEAMYVQS